MKNKTSKFLPKYDTTAMDLTVALVGIILCNSKTVKSSRKN